MSKITIPFKLSKDFDLGVWNGWEIFVNKGDLATITDVIAPDTSDNINPLYLVENKDGKSQAIYRRELVEHGFNWRLNEQT